MKRPKILALTNFAGALALCITATVNAQDPADNGKTLYRENCKGCHTAGSAAGEYTPMTLIGIQWERFFDRKYERSHKDVIDESHGGKPVTESITPEALDAIRQFSIDHAADSESPMTCG